MGALQLIQSKCHWRMDHSYLNEWKSKNTEFFFVKNCQPIPGNEDGGGAETEESACIKVAHT
jgi:hypothetical protein